MDHGKEITLERKDTVPWCTQKVAKGNGLGGGVLPFGLPAERGKVEGPVLKNKGLGGLHQSSI